MTVKILVGDAITRLRKLEDNSVHCVITSPPYWGMRAYQGGDGMIGLETTFDEHLDNLLRVFREVWRVLRTDGTCFLNYGDGYWAQKGASNNTSEYQNERTEESISNHSHLYTGVQGEVRGKDKKHSVYKAKDLMMMPARVALALQADGWWLRSEIPWIKDNPMPESVTDRPTSAHEKVFMLTQSGSPTYWTHRDGKGSRTQPPPDYVWQDKDTGQESDTAVDGWKRVNLWRGHDYFWDQEAVRTPMQESSVKRLSQPTFDNQTGGPKDPMSGNRSHRKVLENLKQRGHVRPHDGFNGKWDGMTKAEQVAGGANMRNYLVVATHPFPGAHFATFPPDLVTPLIKAGTSEHGVCAECGAPWVRMVDKPIPPDHVYSNARTSEDSKVRLSPLGIKRGSGYTMQNWRNQNPTQTTGWQPTCACAADVKPALCLDPFSGAGTVGLVADRLGRDALLIEISPEYAEMARDRIAGDNLMFADVQVVA